MPLNKQTSGYPPINLPDRGWSSEITSVMRYLVPGAGARSGLSLGLPLLSGQPTTGLTPTMSVGTMIRGDEVLDISELNILPADVNWSNRRLYYGLSGMYYGVAANAPTDAVIAEISTDNLSPASITAIAQPMAYAGVRFGVRGVINLTKCTKGADVNLFTWNKPANIGLPYTRVSYAQAVTAAVATSGNAAGDDFLLKVGSTTLVTHAAAGLSVANTLTAGMPSSGTPWVFTGDQLIFRFNQTDVSANLTGGSIAFNAIFEYF